MVLRCFNSIKDYSLVVFKVGLSAVEYLVLIHFPVVVNEMITYNRLYFDNIV